MGLAGVVACAVLVSGAVHGLVGRAFEVLDAQSTGSLTGLLGARALSMAALESRRLLIDLGFVFAGLFAAWRLRAETWPARFASLASASLLLIGSAFVARGFVEDPEAQVPLGLATALLVLVPVAALTCVAVHLRLERRAFVTAATAVLLLGQLGLLSVAVPDPPESHHVPTQVVVHRSRCCPCAPSQLAVLRRIEQRYPYLSTSERRALMIRICASTEPYTRPHAPPPLHAFAAGFAMVTLLAALGAAALVRHRRAAVPV